MAGCDVRGTLKSVMTLKFGVIVVALWGGGVGIWSFMNSLIIAIEVTMRAPPETEGNIPIYNAYVAIQLFLYEYSITMIFIFSGYLLYGAIRDSKLKSSFVLSWLIFAVVSDSFTFLDWLHLITQHHHFFSYEFYMRELLLLGMQFGCLLLVYGYYKNLPKKIAPL